jgi:hypothetical protein
MQKSFMMNVSTEIPRQKNLCDHLTNSRAVDYIASEIPWQGTPTFEQAQLSHSDVLTAGETERLSYEGR